MEKRQEQVLKCLIREYIRNAKPVSSQMLFEKYHLGISPATIRWEMVELTDSGYLYQPYASAGRVPTEKAYGSLLKSFVNRGYHQHWNKRKKRFYKGEMKGKY